MSDKLASTLNEVDQKKKAEEDKRKQLQRELQLSDLKYLMQSQQGRRFFWRLLNHCSVYESIFNTNALTQSHNSGRQDVGHFLMAEIVTASPDDYLKMQNEQQIKAVKENKSL